LIAKNNPIIATNTVKFGKFQRKIKENITVRKITNIFY